MLETQEVMQLDLFEGKILTTEQTLEIQKFIERCDKEVVKKQEENIRIQLLLDEAGFRQGIDYVNDFKIFERTYNHEFGYGYNKTQWEAEVNVMASSGGCNILYDTLYIAIVLYYIYRIYLRLYCLNSLLIKNIITIYLTKRFLRLLFLLKKKTLEFINIMHHYLLKIFLKRLQCFKKCRMKKTFIEGN